jgi:hypothetical protein
MKLSYRGLSYEAEPTTLEVTEGEIRGMYRTQAWKRHHPKLTRRGLTAPVELMYRSVACRCR